LVSGATRADYAHAAAAVLVADGQAGKVYELGGDEPFSMAELAGEITTATGKDVTYNNLSAEDYAGLLTGVGVPGAFAEILADSDLGIARGDLLVSTGDLRRLIGRPTTSLAEAVRAAAAAA
jgi:NAD(P)H dehydrogenase (quinone)